MPMTFPFTAARGATITTAPNASNVDVPFTNTTDGGRFGSLLVTNAGAALAFVRVQNTDGAAQASAIDTPILPNSAQVLLVGYRSSPFTISVFAASATTVYLTPGEGGL